MHVSLEQALIVAAPQAVFCEVAGEAVILDMGSGRYYALDPISTTVWQHLRTPCTLESICTKLQAEYEVSSSRCEADVAALIGQLAEHRLVSLEERVG